MAICDDLSAIFGKYFCLSSNYCRLFHFLIIPFSDLRCLLFVTTAIFRVVSGSIGLEPRFVPHGKAASAPLALAVSLRSDFHFSGSGCSAPTATDPPADRSSSARFVPDPARTCGSRTRKDRIATPPSMPPLLPPRSNPEPPRFHPLLERLTPPYPLTRRAVSRLTGSTEGSPPADQ